MIKTVHVTPIDGGWMIRGDDSVMPGVFSGRAQAERSARRLAAAVADSGEQAEVVVHDRSGVVIGSVVYGPGRIFT